MANSKNTQQVQNNGVEVKKVHVTHFTDSKKYAGYKIICYTEKVVDPFFGVEVESKGFNLVVIPNLYFAPYLGKDCEITLTPSLKDPKIKGLTKISLVDTEKGGVKI